jgi:hypothetical protein
MVRQDEDQWRLHWLRASRHSCGWGWWMTRATDHIRVVSPCYLRLSLRSRALFAGPRLCCLQVSAAAKDERSRRGVFGCGFALRAFRITTSAPPPANAAAVIFRARPRPAVSRSVAIGSVDGGGSSSPCGTCCSGAICSFSAGEPFSLALCLASVCAMMPPSSISKGDRGSPRGHSAVREAAMVSGRQT